jgi:hypothetical protein
MSTGGLAARPGLWRTGASSISGTHARTSPVYTPPVFYYFSRLRRIRKEALWKWQRMQRGWSEADSWSLDHHLATIIVGGCTRLRERELAHPAHLESEEWGVILDKIILGFQSFIDDSWTETTEFLEAKDLFGKWFGALWD